MRKLPAPPLWLEIAVVCILLLSFLPLIWNFSPFVLDSEYAQMAFEKLFQRDDILSALTRSLKIAFMSSVLAIIIASLAAWRSEIHKDNFVAFTLTLSMALPEIVVALALLLSFSMIKLPLGMLSLALAHASFSYAFATLIIRSHCQNFDLRVFEAAKDLGANFFQRVWRVTIPLFLTSLLSAFLLCMTLSLDDYLISAFTSGAGQETLPMKIMGLLRYGFAPELNAVSLMLFLTSFVIVSVGVVIALQKRRKSVSLPI